MSKVKPSSAKREERGPEARNSPLALLLIAVLLVLMVVAVASLVRSQQESARLRAAAISQSEQRRSHNRELGLPLDYPADVLPLWPGAEIKEQERAEVKSTADEPMDQWKIHAETDDDKQEVYEYYNKLLLDQGMAQTLFASVPSGYGVTYANEQQEIQLTVEKKQSDERTQIEITFSRLRRP